MYFVDKIKNEYKDKKIIFFIDMDGVIADYNFGYPLDFKNKRPLKTNIEVFKELSLLNNVELNILSICKKNSQIEDKNEWLDTFAPFLKKNNRVIISKEEYPNVSSKDLKCNYLKRYVLENNQKKVIVIDDDNEILFYLSKNIKEIILYQDSSIID